MKKFNLLLIVILILIKPLISCNKPREIINGYEGFVFNEYSNEKDINYIPSNEEINDAEEKLVEYLQDRTKKNETIYVTVLEEKVPLQNRLNSYKRRYFGRMNKENEKIIKIEFVFIRCAGNDRWKNIGFTNESNKECWWSLQYNVDEGEIISINMNK